MHTAFFLLFLTMFYLTFFVFIQNEKIPPDVSSIFEQDGYIGLISALSTKNNLEKLKNSIQNYKPSTTPPDNSKIIRPLAIIVGGSSFILMYLSILISYWNNHSILELFYTNLITIFFIGLTDMFIVLFFSVFKVVQPGFLIGLNLVLSSDSNPDCRRIMNDGLDQIFPAFKGLIDNAFKSG